MKRKQRIVLGILNAFRGNLSRKVMQKLVFLYCERSEDRIFNFVPFKYGCYSLELADMQLDLYRSGCLTQEKDNWKISKKGEKEALNLDLFELEHISTLERRFSSMPENELIRYVYLAYPFYATQSVILDKILTPEEQKSIFILKKKVENAKLNKSIVSIGYEGYSIDSYIEILVKNNVRVLCDVRKNPISRKPGFSKTSFAQVLENVNIKYYHFPQLGIPSNLRKELNNQEDYDSLFNFYEKNILQHNLQYVEEISSLLDNFGTTAILCFERDPKQCHRTRVIKRLLEFRENDVKVITSKCL